MIYLQLFWAFFQIGLFSFGGGYAALPLISQQVISTYHWISQNTFTDLITISQMTPGPIAVNSSTFVGQYVAHLPGALIATFGCILPSCILVSLLAYFYVKYKDMKVMKTILSYLRPAVVSMIAISGISILISSFFKDSLIGISYIRYHAIIVFILCLILLRKYKMNPILVMVLAGISEVVIQMYIYYPSCNFATMHLQTAKKVRDYFEKQMPIAKCCKIDKREFEKGDIGLYVCQACRKQIENQVKTMSIWEYFDQLDNFDFPDYHGQKMYLQDCFRDRNHPEVHQAVRSLLKKMNIEVIEMKNNKDNSIFCGTLHYETKDLDDIHLSHYPKDVQEKYMQEYVQQFDNKKIICVCNRCLKGILLGKGKGVHLLELLFNK